MAKVETATAKNVKGNSTPIFNSQGVCTNLKDCYKKLEIGGGSNWLWSFKGNLELEALIQDVTIKKNSQKKGITNKTHVRVKCTNGQEILGSREILDAFMENDTTEKVRIIIRPQSEKEYNEGQEKYAKENEGFKPRPYLDSLNEGLMLAKPAELLNPNPNV